MNPKIILRENEYYDWRKMTLAEFILEGNCPTQWSQFFNDNLVQNELIKISNFLERERGKIYPDLENIFRSLYFVPPSEIKVVIIGQDPYHNGSATGLCFSVKNGNNLNPSLRNIYKELEEEKFIIDRSGDLTHWAKQGCLMLNSALTVVENDAGSHAEIWRAFYYLLVKFIADHTHHICWLLMGKNAQEIKINITGNHAIFFTSHPSPFSCRTSGKNFPAFHGSGVFQKINSYLTGQGKIPIKW